MGVYVCGRCKWEYDEARGAEGIAPGTKWADVPDGFVCPVCGAPKAEFAPKPEFDKRVTRNFSYGLFVLTAREGEKDNGCIINTAIQAASDPLRVAIAVNKANYTHDMILRTGAFNLSFLSEASKFATYKNFGFQSGRDAEKLESVAFKRSANGIAYLTEETNAYLSGKVAQSVDLGSHTMFIADITEGAVLSKEPSVTYAYYFQNIKPKPEAAKEAKKGWICTICGYIYEGEILPDDYVCPVCKHPASDFKKL